MNQTYTILIIGVLILAGAGLYYYGDELFPPQATIQGEDTPIGNPYEWVTQYVDPDDPMVEQYTPLAIGTTGNYNGRVTVDDIYSLQKWISYNIRYQTETSKPVSEILQSHKGNCFNKAILLYSMVLNEHQDTDTNYCDSYILLINVVDNDMQTQYHASNLHIFDTGIIISDSTIDGAYIRNICYLTSPESAISEIIDNTNIKAYHITNAVSLTNSYEFQNNQAFTQWAGQQMNVCLGAP